VTSVRSGSVTGNGSAPGRLPFAEPAPTLRRPRNLPGAVLGLLVVVVCALVVASLASSSGNRTEVLVVTRLVPAGSPVGAPDLAVTGVAAGSQVSGVPAGDLDQVVGQVATHDLVPGTLLVRAEIGPSAAVDRGGAVVGLAIKDGDLPASLGAGDHAEVMSTASSAGVAAGAAGSDGAVAAPGTVLVPDAVVRSVAPAADGQSTLVSLSVPLTDAPLVAGANAAGTVSLVQVGG
jgi:hypothetical protein